jgi:hypothetical protein
VFTVAGTAGSGIVYTGGAVWLLSNRPPSLAAGPSGLWATDYEKGVLYRLRVP